MTGHMEMTARFQDQDPQALSVIDLAVGGMTCSMCSDAVKRALTDMDGVKNVSVSLATNLAHVEYTESKECNADTLRELIEDIGYDVTDIILPKQPQATHKKPEPTTLDLAVDGMTCSMCSSAVHEALIAMPGVLSCNVSLSTNTARVEFEESEECSAEILRETVEDIGYDADILHIEKSESSQTSSTTLDLAVGGMTCSMCSSAVHEALIAMPGVVSCNVDLSTNTAQVKFNETPECTAEILRETVEDIGYDADILHTEKSKPQHKPGREDSSEAILEEPDDRLQRIIKQQANQLRARRRNFLWCLAGTLPIVSITMLIPRVFGMDCSAMIYLKGDIEVFGHPFIRESLILWVLATLVQFGSGYSLYKTAYHGIIRRVYGMDVLVTLGMTASYLYAAMATLEAEAGYRFFETSAVLLCFVLLGKWLNAMAVCRTSDALTSLMKLQAKTALIVIPDETKVKWNPATDSYKEKVVPIQSIQPGDMVKVLKGASIPADGKLEFGEMCVDESMITGESIPVLKTPGASVLGGTICTETGSEHDGQVTAAAFVRVTGVGSKTALAQIVQLVQDAQSRQVPIQNLADTISGIFVPSVVALSFITFLVWYACCKGGLVPTTWYADESPATFSLLFGIACLVISCPCALGLATPTAVMVGTGVGARHGVLMKGGETLEVAGKVDAIIFDKTGTLTEGRPVVTDCIRIPTATTLADVATTLQLSAENCLLWLLGSLERNSEHPLATAIVTHAEQNLGSIVEDRGFSQPSGFVASTGRGASGTINGNIYVSVGNRAFAERENLNVSSEVEELLQTLEAEGKTAVLVGVNGSVCGVLGIADKVKDEASRSISHLRDMGVDVWMVTGDSKRTADAIARQLHLPPDRVMSEALPVSKVEQVRRLQSEGLRVAMVGDGVNDSPALAEADVGISMGTGAEIATEASDMVLVTGKVSDVCTALDLSRVIFRRIQLNLLFSMVYNLLSIPLAAGLFFPIFHTRLPPTVAAIAMALSSVSVVCSSLALRLYKPPDVMSTRKYGRKRQAVRNMLRMKESDVEMHALVEPSDEGGFVRPLDEIV